MNLRPLFPLALSLAFLAACQAAPSARPGPAAQAAEPATSGRGKANAPAAAAAPAAAPVPAAPAAGTGPAPVDDVPRVQVHAEGQLGPGRNTLYIDLAPPDGAKLTLESPVSIRGSGGIGLSFPRRLSGPLGRQPMPLRLPIEVADGATGPAQLELSYYWCTDGSAAACRREQAQLNVDLDLSGASAGGEAHLSYRALGDRS